MKKLACLIVVLFLVTVALGERNECSNRQVERYTLASEYLEFYLEEHPNLTQAQRDVLISLKAFHGFLLAAMEEFEGVDPAVLEAEDPVPWADSMAKILHRELRMAFGLRQLNEISDAMSEIWQSTR